MCIGGVRALRSDHRLHNSSHSEEVSLPLISDIASFHFFPVGLRTPSQYGVRNTFR